ncbi:putative ribosome-binding factor A, mitochondrial [Acipenser ruthenus]|uniref:Putative ribosome-binding factor A, mitochondrial n=1 Tax=Acipenser ruthenus TaxID=7906 RepID=A0A444U431_ACIRT|nr:putative ribosome-binding factor A, mitochondrial [Acipenser ruthenus]
MGTRIDDLEKNVSDLMTLAGMDEPVEDSKMCKPSSLEAVLKRTSSPQKGSREDSIRMRTLNTILYKAITDLISTYEVSLPLDFSSCRVYWKISGKSEKDDLIQQVLEKSAPRIRYLLITRQVLGSVPPVTFIKDKQYAAISEVEKLLEAADFGPQESTGDSVSVVNDRRETSTSSNLFGIDHEALNRQIMEHKKRSTEKLTEPIDSSLTEQQQEFLAEMRKKKTIKKKKAKYNFDDDITPETYLLEKSNQEEYTEERDQLEDQLDESEVEKLLEAADFGPQESTGDSVSVVNDRRETSTSSNLFGIDHEALNRQIMEHKKRSTEKLTEPIDSSLTEQQQEFLAEMRKKKTIKKKKAKYNFDDDITPETYLLEKSNQEEYTEERDQLEDQLDESEVKEMMAQEDPQTR